MVNLKTKPKKKKRLIFIYFFFFKSNGNVVVCNPKRGFLHARVVLSLFMLSPFREFVVGFNRGVKGREAGTVPERAAAHPHSASRRGGGLD